MPLNTQAIAGLLASYAISRPRTIMLDPKARMKLRVAAACGVM